MSELAWGGGYCMVCGSPGGHGNLPCPQLREGWPQPEYTQPNKDIDRIERKLDEIIELLRGIRHPRRYGGPL